MCVCDDVGGALHAGNEHNLVLWDNGIVEGWGSNGEKTLVSNLSLIWRSGALWQNTLVCTLCLICCIVIA
jgi:hypothetical protein